MQANSKNGTRHIDRDHQGSVRNDGRCPRGKGQDFYIELVFSLRVNQHEFLNCMSNRCRFLVSLSLVTFTCLVMAWQFLHRDREATLREWVEHGRSNARDNDIISSIYQSHVRAGQLAKVSDIVKRDQMIVPASGLCRYVDLVLPKDARVFIPNMTGPTNQTRIGNYFFTAYYLFPREVGVSLDQPARLTKDGFVGQAAGSDQEILGHGYDAVVDYPPDDTLTLRLLRPRREFPIKEPVTPDWFGSGADAIMAFLLPLLTALAGMWLFRPLFPGLSNQMPLLEQLACALGLGMMIVAALTLCLKLCGFHGYHLIFLAAAAGSAAEIWHDRRIFWAGITASGRRMIHRPATIALLLPGLLVFLILFRLAGLQGLVEFDAVMGWSLKAKIIHLYTGHELVQWFSNPRLTAAHLDYPTLVPSLHAATYDSLGHVDEFVTKFWPAWMLLFLMGALVSLSRGGESRFWAPPVALLGLLLLPATQKYVQMEGGTLPMIFFTVLGFVQCGFWLATRDRSRLGLGLTLLFGAAMAKFEGFIFLALAGGWLLLLPSMRPSLKLSFPAWRVPAFCFLAALPFVCLRAQIPTLHFESGWAGYALQNPGNTLSNWPGLFLVLLARLFVNPDFACWSGETGSLHWTGRWDGLLSLFNQTTLGLAWVCLFMTAALWFAVPARRQVVIWTLAMLIGALAAFSLVFSSFVNITNLSHVIAYTTDDVAGRYLLPILLAWFATIMTVFFTNLPSSETTLVAETTVPDPKASPPT